ncbi:hypothetical protein BH20ACI1_BH20ACI1_09090 [soil metagenome]
MKLSRKDAGEKLMDEKQTDAERRNERTSGIGTGKKTGLYGCAFLILAVIIIFVVLVLTGIYNPFLGTEGVGP